MRPRQRTITGSAESFSGYNHKSDAFEFGSLLRKSKKLRERNNNFKILCGGEALSRQLADQLLDES